MTLSLFIHSKPYHPISTTRLIVNVVDPLSQLAISSASMVVPRPSNSPSAKTGNSASDLNLLAVH